MESVIHALAELDYVGARAAYDQALPLYQSVSGVLGEANCIKGIGDIALAQLNRDSAVLSYDMARTLHHTIGHVLGQANCFLQLGANAADIVSAVCGALGAL